MKGPFMLIFYAFYGVMFLIFKSLEFAFNILNKAIKVFIWFLGFTRGFFTTTWDVVQEGVCWGRRLGLYFGFLELQKIKLSKKLHSTNRF